VPYTKRDLIEHLAGRLAEAGDAARFRALCALVESIYHLRFREDLETWKSRYAALDPDRGEHLIPGISPAVDHGSEKSALEGLRKVLVAANYREIDEQRIQEASKNGRVRSLSQDTRL